MADSPITLDETTRATVASERLVHLATSHPRRHPAGHVHLRRLGRDEIVAGHLADHVKLRIFGRTRGSRCPSNRMCPSMDSAPIS